MTERYDGPLAEGKTYESKFTSVLHGIVKIKKIRGYYITYVVFNEAGKRIRETSTTEIWLRENLVKEIQ